MVGLEGGEKHFQHNSSYKNNLITKKKVKEKVKMGTNFL